MKTDVNGCANIKKGQEQFEGFTATNKKKYVQYDYRSYSGKLFSCIAPTVEQARIKRDVWLKRNG